MEKINTLYLCYFGVREPLVQTQVLPYLRQLSGGGIIVTLLTFEPKGNSWTRELINAQRVRLAADGVRWIALAYHKRPALPATALDVVNGAWTAARLIRREGIQVLHARSHVPVTMALLARRLARCRLVFDIRGLMAEEYADAGIWAEGSLTFRLVKWIERAGIKQADQIVVLTERMRSWLVEGGSKAAAMIEVIPCCVDFDRFKSSGAERGFLATARFEVVYAGSVTGLYMLQEMGRFFLALQQCKPLAFLRILTTDSPDHAAAVLRAAGVLPSDYHIEAVAPAAVPTMLRRASLGISFRKPTFSQIAASPTKIPEYLAAGLPVVSNAGIGDIDSLLECEGVGVVVRQLNKQCYAEAAERAVALTGELGIKDRCQRVAREKFDLIRVGGARYIRVYERLVRYPAPVANARQQGERLEE